jgi:hypothetical protein
MPVDAAYGFATAAARLILLVPRLDVDGGRDAANLGGVAGIAVATMPGGGEPSAVKSDFCSVSVFATGKGLIAGLFMSSTFAVVRNGSCKAAAERCLFPSAHGLAEIRFPGLSWSRMAGGQSFLNMWTTTRVRESHLSGGSSSQTRRHALEQQ